MPTPAVWRDDPVCAHQVDHPYQTHYCSYIRVPRLLTLQEAGSGDALALIVAHQWYELWFKVLLADLRAALASDGQTYEAVKLLKRGLELFRLFDQHADLVESGLARDLKVTRGLRGLTGDAPSEQFRAILALAGQLPRLAALASPGLSETVADYDRRLRVFRERYERFVAATLCPAPAGPSYAEWLRLDELLSLQEGVKSAWCAADEAPAGFWRPEVVSPDENMFIVVHQCFEVYFKRLLNLIDRAVRALLGGAVAEATRLLRPAVLIQRLLVPQIQIPATMLPLDFMRFRNQKREVNGQVQLTGLTPASGTESYQFREIEIVSGLRDDPVFRRFLDGTDKLPIRLLTPRQRERLEQPTLPDAFQHAVAQRGLQRYDDLFTPADVPNPHLDLALLADTLLEFDEFFRFWRLGHVSMVEKVIGGKSGTGFLGPEYLKETTGATLQSANRVFEERQVRPRFFEDLWAVRTRLSR
jgi:tryptophan 2,3-dioxygenase